MESTNRPMAEMTRAYTESATLYWDTLSETNRHVIDYMKSVTMMMWHANPMTALTPMLRQNENRAVEAFASSVQHAQRNNEQTVRGSEEAVDHRRKPAARKATRRPATSGRSGRRTK